MTTTHADTGAELLTGEQIREKYIPISARSFRHMLSVGKFPPADIMTGAYRFWRKSTVVRWVEEQAASTAARRQQKELATA